MFANKSKSLAAAAVAILLTLSGLTGAQAADGPVACGGGGTFTITSNVVTGNTGCLGSVSIPDSVTSIGSIAFVNSGITSVTFGAASQLTTISANAFGTTNLTSIVIPASVTFIGDSAFHGSNSTGQGLTSVTFASPSSLVTIDGAAFAHSRFSSVSIPSTVTSIGVSAFTNSLSLATVNFSGPAPTVGNNAFNGIAAGAKAVRASNLTGYGANGSTWNRLLVEEPPVLCAAGTYSSNGYAPCTNAQAGYFVNSLGSASQTPCPAGTTSGVAATSCTQIVSAPVAEPQPVVNVPQPVLLTPKTFAVGGYSESAIALSTSMKNRVKTFVSANPKLTKLNCVGDVTGLSKNASQAKLATSRAKSACAYAKSLNSSLVVSHVGKQSKTSGKVTRSVAFTLAP